MNAETIKANVNKILLNRGITYRSIASLMEENERNVSNQLSGKTELKLNTLIAALTFLPDVSAECLLRGEGDMFKKEHAGTTINLAKAEGGNVNAGGTQTISASADEVNTLKKRIAELEQDKMNMQKIIDKLV